MKMNNKNLIKIAVSSCLIISSQIALAHTRLQTPVIDENSARHGSNYNNEVIGHGCKDASGAASIDTIGTVVVFPDGADSTITVNGEASDKKLIDYVTNWGSPVKKVQSSAVFSSEALIKDPLGNTLGYWSAGGSLKAGFTGLFPFRTSGVVFEPTSCAKTVKFLVAIADICEMTKVSGFEDSKVMLWTPAVGSIFDGAETLNGYNSPASLTVNRVSDLPAACGDGEEIVVAPTASQLDRDMTIEVNGAQVWPMP